MAGTGKKYYAVARGHRAGIYDAWGGPDGAEAQVRGFPGARYRGFRSEEDARDWLSEHFGEGKSSEDGAKAPVLKRVGKAGKPGKSGRVGAARNGGEGRVIIYTDGGSINNPGPGGYGVVKLCGGEREEYSGGFRLTTNNRMELMACIVALCSLKSRSRVTLYSDSIYLVNAVMKGWARKWRAKGWMRNRNDRAENADLWEQILELCDAHEVDFVWVKGHCGNIENERCDQLVQHAARRYGLPPDIAYEESPTRKSPPSLID